MGFETDLPHTAPQDQNNNIYADLNRQPKKKRQQTKRRKVKKSNILYQGRAEDLFKIFVQNIFFSIITLGIYTFWGTTRLRRYLWSRTSFAGERLEYCGRGLELFLGFMIFTFILVLFSAGLFFLYESFVPRHLIGISTSLTLSFILVLFMPAGQYFALRYRLTRTVWRGMRGNMEGSAWIFMLRYWASLILSILSLGLLAPQLRTWLITYPLRNMMLGEDYVDFEATPFETPYWSYSVYYFVSFLYYCTLFIIITFFMMVTSNPIGAFFQELFGLEQAFEITNYLPSFLSDALYSLAETFPFGSFIILLYPCFILLQILIFVVSCWWNATFLRFMCRQICLAGGYFRSNLTGGQLLRLIVMNMVLTTISLGLYLPWVWHRNARYIVGSLNFGPIDGLDTLVQNRRPRPRYGEGLSEFAGF